ncbi:MAG: L,D-transpeptidase [Povalibacter sp.]
MKCRILFLCLFGASLFVLHVQAADLPWRDSKQLILVVTPGWDANRGTLRTFEMAEGKWKPHGAAVPITVGRTGSGWGLGLHAAQSGGMQKREGDGRSPAGVFRVGDAFGYASEIKTRLHYLAMSESDYCVDVNDSPLYNQIVDANKVGEAAVKGSTEPMRRDLHANGDQRYKMGFVIEHNAKAKPAGGSCIFAHLWKAPGEPTTGCTAMDEPVMRDLLAWLDAQRRPVFVLLPQHEYERLKGDWQLP